jgi:hypothetical protein
MRTAAIAASLLLLFVICSAAQSNSSRNLSEILGTWEGESECTVPNSPCHDEHVIFEITLDKNSRGALKSDGYKVVNGERQFMGTLRCEYDAPEKTLSCTARGKNFDDWEYTLSGDTLKGTLTVDSGKTLYRRVTVKKATSS